MRRIAFGLLLAALVAGMLYPIRQFTDPILAPLRALGGVLLALAALNAVSVFWQRVRLFRVGDALHVRAFLFFPHRRSIPASSLRGMNILKQEVRSSMKSGYRALGWRWRVLIHADAGEYDFWCGHHYESSQPMPQRVAEFARQLQHMTGLPCPAPQTIGWRSGRSGAYTTGRRTVIASEPVYTHQRFRSLDDMPPALREEAEAAFAEMRARGLATMRREGATVSDSEGNVHTYHSLDEMPPEIRRRFEGAMGRRRGEE